MNKKIRIPHPPPSLEEFTIEDAIECYNFYNISYNLLPRNESLEPSTYRKSCAVRLLEYFENIINSLSRYFLDIKDLIKI